MKRKLARTAAALTAAAAVGFAATWAVAWGAERLVLGPPNPWTDDA